MKRKILTISEFSKEIGKTKQWVWQAIKLGKFKAEKIEVMWFLPESEAKRYKRKPFTLSFEDKAKLQGYKKQTPTKEK